MMVVMMEMVAEHERRGRRRRHVAGHGRGATVYTALGTVGTLVVGLDLRRHWITVIEAYATGANQRVTVHLVGPAAVWAARDARD